MDSENSSTVKARDFMPLHWSSVSPNTTDDETGLNLNRRPFFDPSSNKGIFRLKRSNRIGTLNCHSLNSAFARAELNLLINKFILHIVCIQEHRLLHKENDPEIISHDIGKNILFTASAYKNEINASVGGVGLTVQKQLLPILTSIKKVNDRILIATFRGNPKTVIISCYSPHNHAPFDEVEAFYEQLSNVISTIPPHNNLIIGGDFNARITGKFSYHQLANRNGELMEEFLQQHHLLAGNTLFQKPERKLWTWRHPAGHLAQIDFILYRKRWRNSFCDCQAHTSSATIGSDHNIVSAKIRLSLRAPKTSPRKTLFWRALRHDKDLALSIDDSISSRFEDLPIIEQTYTSFVAICNEVGREKLPSRPKRAPSTVDHKNMEPTRENIANASTQSVQYHQNVLRQTYNRLEDEKLNQTLSAFEKGNHNNTREAWNLIKELMGKNKSFTFIQRDNRLQVWKEHFQNLLSVDRNDDSDNFDCVQQFDIRPDINTAEFSEDEITVALKAMKSDKAPGLDGLTLDVWKLQKSQKYLKQFCIKTFNGVRPDEWGLSGIVPVPKKGDLTRCTNYRGISLTQIASKVYNRLILNRIRPSIDSLLRSSQNGFRPGRSTTSHLLALRRIIEELQNHKKEAVITFIDFKKAFDSIDRKKMLKILSSYGIPPELVAAIKVMYENTSALVITPEGNTDVFKIDTGVLQGDPLAPFLFIVCLDYALRTSIGTSDGLTLKRRRSRRAPPELLPDLAFADDIALMEDTINKAEAFLHKVEIATQTIGLFLNASKTKVMHLNPTANNIIRSLNGDEIEKVDDFLYLGGYTNTTRDIKSRITKAWGALNSLTKIWCSRIKTSTKIRIFKSTVEPIFLYGCESWTMTKSLAKKVDGTYTRMLRRVKNVSWRAHMSNEQLYGPIPKLSATIKRRRLTLAGHVFRHKEPAGSLIFWAPEEPRRRGRPNTTLIDVLKSDTGLNNDEMRAAMTDRSIWKTNFIMSPD